MLDIKLLVSDFDGCLTDGTIHTDAKNRLYDYSVYDGFVKTILEEIGIKFAIISGKSSIQRKVRCEEMKADYIFLGIADKAQCVKDIAKKMCIGVESIAYFGDDVNDIESMRICGLSGCPNNAVEDVKSICSFISDKNGGSGALRTFAEFIKNAKQTGCPGEHIFKISKEISSISKVLNTPQFNDLVSYLKTIKGNIITCGLGKSAIVAQMIASLFATSCKQSFCLDVTMAMHGELGNISKRDCVILFSKSGSSKELFNFCNHVKNKGAHIVLITSTYNSIISSICEMTFVLPISEEYYSHCLIPTTSLVQHIVFGQALVYYSTTYTVEDLKINHPEDFDGLR